MTPTSREPGVGRSGWSPSRAHAAAAAAAGSALLLAAWQPAWAIAPLGLFLLVTLAGAFFPRMQWFLPIACHGPRSTRAVTLTFDDGPDPATTLPLLELLDRLAVPAAFFLVGEAARRHPDLVREIVRRRHEIGSHTLRHDTLMTLRPARRMEAEIRGGQEALAELGVATRAFRPPVGVTNPSLRGVLDRLDLECVAFSQRAWDAGNRRLPGAGQRLLRGVRPGDILVLHDRAPRPPTLPADLLTEVEAVVTGCRERGLRIVPLSELLGRKLSG